MAESAPMRVVAPAPIVVFDEHVSGEATRSVLIASDLVPYRPRGEVVFLGHAHAPNGKPCGSLTARLAVVGQRPYVDKAIHVFGERVVLGDGQFSTPVPFTRMSMVYERAVHNPDENPNGIVAAPGAPAPNLIDPGDPTSPSGFGPIPGSWPTRKRMLRQLDPTVIEAPIPEIPDAFAWSYFQSAPTDQRCPFFEGNEWLVLDGLHPDHAHFETQLPSIRAAARLYQAPQGEPLNDAPFREFALAADTMFVDGDRGLVCLVWRGNLDIDPNNLASLQVLAGLELAGRSVPWPQSMRPPPPSMNRESLSGVPTIGRPGSGAYPAVQVPSARSSSPGAAPPSAPRSSQPPAQPPMASQPAPPMPSQPAPAMPSQPAPAMPSQPAPPMPLQPAPPMPMPAQVSPTPAMVPAVAVPAAAPPVVARSPLNETTPVSTPSPVHQMHTVIAPGPIEIPLQEVPAVDEPPTNRNPLAAAPRPPEPSPDAAFARERAVTAPSPSSGKIAASMRNEEKHTVVVPPASLSATRPLGATLPFNEIEALIREATPSSRTPAGSRELAHSAAKPGSQPASEPPADAPQSLNPTTLRKPKFDDPETYQPDSAAIADILQQAEIMRKETAVPFPIPAQPPPTVVRPQLQRTPTPPPMSTPQGLAAIGRARAAEAAALGAEAARQHIAGAMRRVRPPKTTIRGLGDPRLGPFAPAVTNEEDAFSEASLGAGRPAPITAANPRGPVVFDDESTTSGADAEEAIARALSGEPGPFGLAGAKRNAAVDADDDAPPTRASLGMPNLPPRSDPPPGPLAEHTPIELPGAAAGLVVQPPPAIREAAPAPVDIRDELLRRVKSGETLAGMSLEGVDLSGLDLAGQNLSGARLRNVSLRSANLEKTDLSGSQLDGADLTHAKLAGANLERASLRAAILSDATLTGATLTDADLEGAIGTSASFQDVTAQRVRFVGARFDCARFDGSNLEAADFSEAIVDGASFAKTILSEARLYEIRGEAVSFIDAKLTGARLDTSVLVRAQFKGIDAADSLWDQAEVDQATFTEAKLAGASFIKTSCREANFERADLSDARFNRSILWNARFSDAMAEGANFDGADTRGAVLPTTSS